MDDHEWFTPDGRTPNNSTDQEKFIHGFSYHRGQLRGLFYRFVSRAHHHDLLIKNAVLEQFLVHARVLMDAFFEPPREVKRDDDLTVAVIDGFERLALPDVAARWRVAVHKRAAHLTKVEKVTWELSSVFGFLEGRMAELDAHLAKGQGDAEPNPR
ncbi:MAG: hypothetical protein HS104_14300 [Polyangiaceae bacterium]|nr:hypothetical protein [Polyangiaceae bacterium]MCL4748917.1 hypothetical protein [Myxococcales bacterium]